MSSNASALRKLSTEIGRVSQTATFSNSTYPDNRASTAIQRRIQGMADNSEQTARLNALRALTATSKPVQAKFVHGPYEFTEGAKYGVRSDDREGLLVSPGASLHSPDMFQKRASLTVDLPISMPHEVKAEKETKSPVAESSLPELKSVPFDVWSSKFNFSAQQPNDCGQYAQGLALGNAGWGANTGSVHTDGLTADANVTGQYDPDDDLKPDGPTATRDRLSLNPGDMYDINWHPESPQGLALAAEATAKKGLAIAEKVVPSAVPLRREMAVKAGMDRAKVIGDGANFHAATVVAKDGSDHVTSEANSGEKYRMPNFQIYGTQNDTFYQKHSDDFTHREPGDAGRVFKPGVQIYRHS